MADPWAAFRVAPQSGEGDPWAAFRSPGVQPDAPIAAMGSDGVSGDELRMRTAGNTRAQMRPEDIEAAYNVAQERGDRPEQQAMSEAYVRREKADSPVMMAAGDTLRQFAKGVPVIGGVADEANAAISGGMSYLTGNGYGPAYGRSLDYQRARDSVFEQDNPATSFGLQLAGGVASGVGAAAKVAPVLGNMSRAAILGTGLGGGATLGAADGFTRGETMGDRAVQAGIGGIVGGAVGLAAPVAAKGISSGTQRLVDALTTNRQLGKMGLDRPSADVLARALMADDTLGQAGAANIAKAGPGAMLADAGPTAAAILDTTIQRGGPGANVASRAINQRATDAARSVAGALDTSLGPAVGLESAEEGIRTGTAAARRSAYDAAYASPIDYTNATGREIERIVQDRVLPEHISTANKLMRLNGEQSQQIMAKIADDGTVTFQQMPDVRQLDYITRAINQAAKSGDGQGALGGQTPVGAAYERLAGELRGLMRKNAPAYGQALDTAADPIARREALQLGSELLSSRISRDEVTRQVRGMSQAERTAATQGIRSQIDDAMANVTRVMSDPNLDARQATKALRDLSSDAVRDKVAAVIGPSEARTLFQQLDEATRAFELRATTAQNSKTFARTVTNEAVRDVTEPGPIGRLMEGKPIQASRSLVQALLGTGPQAKVAREDQIYGKLAQALTGPRGVDAQNFSLGLEDAYRRRATNKRLAEILGSTSAGGLSGGAYQAIGQTAGAKGR